MMPYEIGFLVFLLALVSTFNALFRETRWLSFVCLSLAVFGVAGLADLGPTFETFFNFGPSAAVIFLIGALFSGPVQRHLTAILSAGIMLGCVYTVTAAADYQDKALGQLILFGVSMALPAFIGKVDQRFEDRVEKILSAQQLWARLAFLFWARVNFTNIHHYEFFATVIPAVTIGAAAVLLLRVASNRGSWFLAARGFVSLAIFAGGLAFEIPEIKFLVFWTLVLALTDLLPGIWSGRAPSLVRRLSLGAYGGCAFWGLLFFLEKAPLEIDWKIAWGAMIAGLGLCALLLPGRSEDAEDIKPWISSPAMLVHAAFLTVVLYWPVLRGMGG